VDYKVSFAGGLRSGPNDPWMRATVEWSTYEPSSRRFLLRARRYGIPFDAFHRYVGGSATFEVRIASLFPVIDARGAEMDRWATPVAMYHDVNGRKVPAHAEARWTVVGTTFAYARFDVVEIAYNVRAR
jgi:hypothetical protein